MDRKYRPLRPIPHGMTPGPTSRSAIGSALHNKRKRIGVAVACDPCRRRKTRCDGKGPVCGECEQRADSCIYEPKDSSRDSGSSENNNDSTSRSNTSSTSTDNNTPGLVEAIQLLNAMPPQDAIDLLQSLKNIADSNVILASLRSRATTLTTHLPYESPVLPVRNIRRELGFSVDLEKRFPFAYLDLSPINVDMHSSPFQRLAKSNVASVGQDGRTRISLSPPLIPKILHDQLKTLRIRRWTNVPVTDSFAWRAITLYLETDHPVLCSFEPNLFIRDLISNKGPYCTPLLVNALMYLACQMYCTVDSIASSFVDAFREEAEKLWETERAAPSALTMVASQYLGFGYLVQGKDHAVLAYLSEARRIGTQLGLFGVKLDALPSDTDEQTPEEIRATAYSAWGVFNWTIFMGLFYHQPGVEYAESAPTLPIPDNSYKKGDTQGLTAGNSETNTFGDGIFPVLCEFWSIMHGMVVRYYNGDSTAIPRDVPLQFAEDKFQELMEWASRLPLKLTRNEHNQHHVVILHLWFHAAILDIFRPFLRNGPKLPSQKEVPTRNHDAEAIYAASVEQLKRLTITYRFNYTSSAYSIPWHTSMLYVANAVLQSRSEDWLFYFLLCLYGYENLRTSYPVAEPIARGLLSMAMRSGGMSSGTARQILTHLRGKGLEPVPSEIRATFMLDLDLAMSDPNAATAESLADTFEDTAMMADYTNAFPEA